MDNAIEVDSWVVLQEKLFHNSWDERLGRFRSPYVYRGLPDATYSLKTSLMRLGGSYDALERHLLRNFRKYARRDKISASGSIWNWLAVAQHYGLPTRLLDWTYSPYVALHFMTANIDEYDRDGVIWAVNYVKVKDYLPNKLKYALIEEGSNIFTAEILEDACHTLHEFDSLQKTPFLAFLEPPSLDERIVNQYALFSLLSDSTYLLNTWLDLYPELYFKIIIPARLKWEIRDKLDQANITERVLFPGLDGLSVWLRRHYTPKNSS